eukprot:CAMPEP_0206594930 /NCGR_PEP_ID=MMETSP0325_2-20121206/42720_1 /ASSEMBLY_ACC=CAM_ASM_000347 /TAXON_ID=2866 /ORGANISM="Crypthecodinium cohnii, Strain Seligo" /LENGTH=230 /DNA_ID=CAMNT_0054105591 /DNA_START=44 /DNA_END=736 /DNA_ORIENTATION=-
MAATLPVGVPVGIGHTWQGSWLCHDVAEYEPGFHYTVTSDANTPWSTESACWILERCGDQSYSIRHFVTGEWLACAEEFMPGARRRYALTAPPSGDPSTDRMLQWQFKPFEGGLFGLKNVGANDWIYVGEMQMDAHKRHVLTFSCGDPAEAAAMLWVVQPAGPSTTPLSLKGLGIWSGASTSTARGRENEEEEESDEDAEPMALSKTTAVCKRTKNKRSWVHRLRSCAAV